MHLIREIRIDIPWRLRGCDGQEIFALRPSGLIISLKYRLKVEEGAISLD